MGPAIMALVGVLLQVTLVSESSDRRTAKDLNPADVDRVISSALRQLSTAVYNNLSTDQKPSIEDVQSKLASLFNDLQELCQTLSIEPNDLAGLNTDSRNVRLYPHPRSLYQPDVGNDVHRMRSDDRPYCRFWKSFSSRSMDPECDKSLLRQHLQIISDIPTASDYGKDAHARPSPGSTIRNVDSTNLLKVDRLASREGDSQHSWALDSAVFREASSRCALLNNAIDAQRYGGIDQAWTIRPSAIERGVTSTTSHRKDTSKEIPVYEREANDRGNRNPVLQNYGRVVLGCSAPQSFLENHMTHNYDAESNRIVSELFDRDLGNYGMDRHHSVTGSVKAGDSTNFQDTDDVRPPIDGCGNAGPHEVWVGANDIRIMFTQAAFEGFIRLWETYKQGATSTHESLNNNTQPESDINEVCSRLIQLKVMRTLRSGLGPLFDLYRARLSLVGFYEAYEEFKAQIQAESITGAKFRPHRAISLDDPNDPIALQRARNALAARRTQHKKNQLIDELNNRVKELEADLEQAGPGQDFIAEGTDRTESDVSSIGVASVANNLLVDCLNARNGQSFTPKQRANLRNDIVRFSIEARKYAPFIKSFGLGILALMPQQCRLKFSKSDTKQKGSTMEGDILSFVNENPGSVEFCRVIEEKYMTIARNNSDTTSPDPRDDVRLHSIFASISLGTLGNRTRPDSFAKLPEPFPGQGAASRTVPGHVQDTYSTNRLPCIVCKVKNIPCSYKIDPSACEECRKRNIRCMKEVPLGEHRRVSGSISPCFVDTPMEMEKSLGESGESGILQYRSVVDLTKDAGVAGPALRGSNSYPGPALKCRRCGKTDDCAWCPGSDGYRFLCGICGHQYLMGKLGNTTPSVQPPITDYVARHNSPVLNEKPELYNGDVAVVGPLGTTSPEHQPAGKKRRASASVAIQEEQKAIKRAKNREAKQKYRAKKARETSDLRMRKEALGAALALLKSAGGSG